MKPLPPSFVWTSEHVRARMLDAFAGFPGWVAINSVRVKMQTCPPALFSSQLQWLIADGQILRIANKAGNGFLHALNRNGTHNHKINQLPWRPRAGVTGSGAEVREHLHRVAERV